MYKFQMYLFNERLHSIYNNYAILNAKIWNFL